MVHPITRRVSGAIDLSCLVEHTSPLMLPLVMRVATEIENKLLAGTPRRDRVLLDAYLRVAGWTARSLEPERSSPPATW